MSKNKKNIPAKLHIRKGDQVVIVAGKDKGVKGEIIRVFPKQNKAIVNGANIVKKHMRPTETDAGGIQEIPAPIHASNLMLVDPKTGEATRIGRKLVDGKLVRYSKKSGEIIK